MSQIIKFFSRLWGELFKKTRYRVYVGGFLIFEGNKKKEALGCFEKHCSLCRGSRYGGKVTLISKSSGFDDETKVLKKLIIEEGSENDIFKHHVPFKSGS